MTISTCRRRWRFSAAACTPSTRALARRRHRLPSTASCRLSANPPHDRQCYEPHHDGAARVFFAREIRIRRPKHSQILIPLDVIVRTDEAFHLAALVLIRERSSISACRVNGPDIHGVAGSAPSRKPGGSGRHFRSFRRSLSGSSWVGAASYTALL